MVLRHGIRISSFVTGYYLLGALYVNLDYEDDNPQHNLYPWVPSKRVYWKYEATNPDTGRSRHSMSKRAVFGESANTNQPTIFGSESRAKINNKPRILSTFLQRWPA